MLMVLTGARGFVGSRVLERLVSEGREVIAVDCVEPPDDEVDGVTWLQSDLSGPSDISDAVEDRDYTLIHLAWDMRRNAGDEVQAANVRVLEGLLEEGGRNGLAKLIVFGSAEEYGGCSGEISEEDEPVFPLSAYGRAKSDARERALKWSSETGIPVIWLRPFIIYGPGQRGDMLIPYAVRKAREKEDADFSDGKQDRDFVFVDDIVAAVSAAVSRDISDAQVINLGTGDPVRVCDVLSEIARQLEAEACFHIGARKMRPGEPESQYADTAKAKRLLGWEARTKWREGIAATCAG